MSRDLLGALPPVRGRYRPQVPLAPRTWLRVGGPAEVVFQPADAADLAIFLKGKPAETRVTPIGVASNLLVRDGGLEGVVVRFSGPLAEVDVDDECLRVGAGATDRMIAIQAMKAGLSGLEFLIGIPGTLGGAVRMNAGAFGGETAEVVERVVALDPAGRRHELRVAELGFGYRHSGLPADWIVLGAVLRATQGDPAAIEGRAMVSDKHCNFLINSGGATAAELEELGERVRARVLEHSGVALEWEIHRIGRPAPDRSVDDWEAAA
ncbi:MAG: murB [Geminicoccaceae bacterium]|nr:murB [Geminicoccaceae bacterium]